MIRFMRLKYEIFNALSLIALLGCADIAHSQVMTGLDNLIAQHWAPLNGKHVGLITNQTGVTHSGQLGTEVFLHADSVKLIALFAPEHGLMGTQKAGIASDSPERYQGIPVYSLYGSTRKPTKTMLRGINALVFDIQDVGVRPYTYLSTMVLSMEAAAERGIPFYVLDRPNPLSGERIEGNIISMDLLSFVGQVPVPYLHGMTLGELAKMAKAKGWFKNASKLKLTVIPMRGWKRSMYWYGTGLTWTAPSPNVPHFENAVGLAMLGATGELGVISVGVGSDSPFLKVGSTLMLTEEIRRIASESFIGIPAVISNDFTATTSAGTKTYHGVQFVLASNVNEDRPARADPASIPELYAPQFRMLEAMLHDTTFRTSFDALPQSVNAMFEKVTGMHGLLEKLKRCEDLTPVFESWKRDAEKFRKEREPYLLYH